MILYIFVATILAILLSIRMYIKFKYGFWYYQPVFHLYDVHYYFYKQQVIRPELPPANKHVNFHNIRTYDFVSINKTDKMLTFINQHYLTHKHNHFRIPTPIFFQSYFQHHNSPCYFSLYTDSKNSDIVKGIITCRPLYLQENELLSCYYVDYLCVDKKMRKQGIAPQLIQTHEYNYRRLNPRIQISLFKREDELTGIVPLCAYSTFGFDARAWAKSPPHRIPAMYDCVEWTKQTSALFFDFFQHVKMKNKKNKNTFELLVYPEWSHLCHLVQTKNIYVYGVESKDTKQLQCMYFFRKSCTVIDGGEVLSCFASIKNVIPVKDFVQGFKMAFHRIASNNQHPFAYAAIENISHNHFILDTLREKYSPFVSSPTAYFLYNYIHLTIPANNVLIIN